MAHFSCGSDITSLLCVLFPQGSFQPFRCWDEDPSKVPYETKIIPTGPLQPYRCLDRRFVGKKWCEETSQRILTCSFCNNLTFTRVLVREDHQQQWFVQMSYRYLSSNGCFTGSQVFVLKNLLSEVVMLILTLQVLAYLNFSLSFVCSPLLERLTFTLMSTICKIICKLSVASSC